MNVDTDTQKLISETISRFTTENLIKKGSRPEEYDVCPHCNKEIFEKHTYSDDGGDTMRHSDCGYVIEYPETDLNEILPWLRPYVEKEQQRRRKIKQESATDAYPQDKEMMNLSGEAKYSKQQPGGEMLSTGLTESEEGEKIEELVIDAGDYSKMFDGQVRPVNMSNLPLKIKITKITRGTADAFIITIYNA